MHDVLHITDGPETKYRAHTSNSDSWFGHTRVHLLGPSLNSPYVVSTVAGLSLGPWHVPIQELCRRCAEGFMQ